MKILEEIGLTKTEIKIYLALLELGQTTTTQIVRKANIHASKVYEFLDRLIQKGLASYVIKSNKKYFSASQPEHLRDFLRRKEKTLKEQKEEVNKLIPSLNEIKKKGKNKINAEIYESLEGIKAVYEKILQTSKKEETVYVLGAPRIANELVEGFLLDWHKRRIKKGIKCKYIYDPDVRDFGKIREKMKLTEVRYLPKGMVSPVWIDIFNEYSCIGHIKGNNAVLFLIRDKAIAENYMDYFNLIWKQSKN